MYLHGSHCCHVALCEFLLALHDMGVCSAELGKYVDAEHYTRSALAIRQNQEGVLDDQISASQLDLSVSLTSAVMC